MLPTHEESAQKKWHAEHLKEIHFFVEIYAIVSTTRQFGY
jgi:hypothetical protein